MAALWTSHLCPRGRATPRLSQATMDSAPCNRSQPLPVWITRDPSTEDRPSEQGSAALPRLSCPHQLGRAVLLVLARLGPVLCLQEPPPWLAVCLRGGPNARWAKVESQLRKGESTPVWYLQAKQAHTLLFPADMPSGTFATRPDTFPRANAYRGLRQDASQSASETLQEMASRRGGCTWASQPPEALQARGDSQVDSHSERGEHQDALVRPILAEQRRP